MKLQKGDWKKQRAIILWPFFWGLVLISGLMNLLSAFANWAMLEKNTNLLLQETDRMPVLGLGEDGTITTANGEVWAGVTAVQSYPGSGVWFVPRQDSGVMVMEVEGYDFWTMGALTGLVVLIAFLWGSWVWFKGKDELEKSSRKSFNIARILWWVSCVVVAILTGAWVGVGTGIEGGLLAWAIIAFVATLCFVTPRVWRIRATYKHNKG